MVSFLFQKLLVLKKQQQQQLLVWREHSHLENMLVS